VELADGRVIGIEVKATAAPVPDDARHLWLYALPICAFWT